MKGHCLALLVLACCGDDAQLPEVIHAADWVDPRIGTGGLGYAHGSCFVGPVAPHGLAKPGPDTNGPFGTVSFQHYSGYFADDDRIRGFSSVHLHGTGATDYGVLSVMPTLAFEPTKTRVVDYETRFAKQDEQVHAGYYGVTLANGIRVELAATAHVAVERYTLPADGALVIDLAKVLDSGTIDAASIDIGSGEITGQLHHLGGMSAGYGGYTLYFVAHIDRAWSSQYVWSSTSAPAPGETASGTNVGSAVMLPAGTSTIAIGLSLVSVEGARRNLAAEVPTIDFDAVRTSTYDAWDALLSRVLITGGTEAQRRTFYTSLYHTFLMPTEIADVDGTYQLAGSAPAVASGWRMLSDLSLWDTYRTVSPLHAWLAPASARDTARSLAAFGAQIGIFPKWPVAIGESGTMLGASAEIAIADAVVRGVADTGAADAWPLLRAAAMDATSPPGGRGGRDQVEAYMQYGYVPRSAGRSVSLTAEYAHDDFALAQLAGALGHDADRDALMRRRLGWRMLYDPAVGFLRGRNADGTFPTGVFDPLPWTPDYAEANAWQSLFETGIHDPDGVVEILGGHDAAIAKLSMFFDKAKADWALSDEAANNFPRSYYWAGNEPDLNAVFLFAQLRRPDLTQKWLRWLEETMYSDQPDGVPGNDDGGAMGAWYVLSALGVYPVSGSDRWIIGAPLFPRARVLLDGHELVIEATGDGPYVAGVELDGAPISVPELTHTQLTTAAKLHFTLTDSASQWGR